jgi:hypothetical protein
MIILYQILAESLKIIFYFSTDLFIKIPSFFFKDYSKNISTNINPKNLKDFTLFLQRLFKEFIYFFISLKFYNNYKYIFILINISLIFIII